MKKFFALLLAVIMVLAMVACANTQDEPQKSSGDEKPVPSESAEPTKSDAEEPAKSEAAEVTVMTHDEYIAAELGADVVIEAYVQGKQSWWNDQATLYLMDENGGYFAYNAACSQADYDKLVKGAKVKVTGKKSAWSGEVEVTEATLEIEEGSYIAEAFDATSIMSDGDELAKHQNEFVCFKGLTVVEKTDADGNKAAFFYDWDNSGAEKADADLYFDVELNGQTYTFTVEYYLCNENSDAYKAVQALKVGDKIDVEGFLYWYNGMQPHVTSVKAAE